MSIFTQELPKPKVGKNSFNLSHQNILTCNMGDLIPIDCVECLPGDTFKFKSNLMIRFAPMQAPVYDNIDVMVYHFFVPNRILWKDWENFITGGKNNDFDAPLPSLSFDRIGYCRQPLLDDVDVNGFLITGDGSVDALRIRSSHGLFDYFEKTDGSKSSLYATDASETPGYNDFLANGGMVRKHTPLYDFFFGSGSLVDYLGVPVRTVVSEDSADDAHVPSASSVADARGNMRSLLFGTNPSSSHTLSKSNFGVGVSNVNALPFLAYQSIWNNWFRDENLEDEVEFDDLWLPDSEFALNGNRLLSSNTKYYAFGFNPRSYRTDSSRIQSFVDLWLQDQQSSTSRSSFELIRLRQKAWKKDYFTSALPWPQRGEEVRIPVGDGSISFTDSQGRKFNVSMAYNSSSNSAGRGLTSFSKDDYGVINYLDPSEDKSPYPVTVSSGTIRDLRRAYALQSWLERNALGGYRYIENMYSHFGVNSSDGRFQRPEYIGGFKQPVTVSEILQQSAGISNELGVQPLGSPAGHMVSVGRGDFVEHYCEEHGYIMTIMCIVPQAMYYQGTPRHLSRQDRFDFAWPEFDNLGAQSIKNKELYSGLDDKPLQTYDADGDFGYQYRYSEYKWLPNEIHGDFRTDLKFWNFARTFKELPKLNSEFIRANVGSDPFAVTDENTHKCWVSVYHEMNAVRPISVFGEPSLI